MTSVAATPVAAAARRPSPLGAVPYVALAVAAGLALVALADALSRTGQSGGQPAFWAGILLIVAPAALRLAGP